LSQCDTGSDRDQECVCPQISSQILQDKFQDLWFDGQQDCIGNTDCLSSGECHLAAKRLGQSLGLFDLSII
jgi:hypothetical protein